jgi:hypothetical protein
MRQDDKDTFQKLIGCHPGCMPEPILWQFLSISRKLRGALRWDILRNLNGQPKPPEQDMHEETIQRILALMEAYEHAKLDINYRLENWGEPYSPYLDIQDLCDLRIRASAWREGNTAAFLGYRGEVAYQKVKQSQRGKRRRKRPSDPLKRTLENLVKEISGDFNVVIAAFKSDAMVHRSAALGITRENILGELRKAGMAFIEVQEVDEQQQRIYYRLLNRQEKSVSVKRIANLLAQIKTPL